MDNDQMIKDLLQWWQKSIPNFHKTVIDSEYKQTLLHLASGKGYIPIAKELIRMGSDLNAQDSTSMTPLHTACLSEHVPMMKFLLENGAKVDVVDENQLTPLHVTTLNGFTEGTKVLLDHGASIEALDKHGQSPLYLAIHEKNSDAFQLMIDRASDMVNKVIETSTGSYPIHLASDRGDLEIVQVLLKKGAVLFKDKLGLEPIHLAARKGHIDVVKLLIERHQTSIKARDKGRRTPLHYATKEGNSNMIKLLLANKAQVNAQDIQKSTSLHVACKKGLTEITKLLVEHNASVNLQDQSGLTPLHVSILNKHVKIVEILIHSKKCNLNLKNRNGKTAQTLALESNELEIIKVICKEMSQLLENNDLNVLKPPSINSNECAICFEPRNGIFALLPCYHANSCEKCSMKLVNDSDKCPICRVNVKQYQKIFM